MIGQELENAWLAFRHAVWRPLPAEVRARHQALLQRIVGKVYEVKMMTEDNLATHTSATRDSAELAKLADDLERAWGQFRNVIWSPLPFETRMQYADLSLDMSKKVSAASRVLKQALDDL